MRWYIHVFASMLNFQGRSRRQEYWTFQVINFTIIAAFIAADSVLGAAGSISGLYSLAQLLPNISVSIRRLHDTGRSGFWFFILLIPLVGVFVYFYFMLQDGQEGENRYGADPQGQEPFQRLG
ncbi:DUF805 domain-containing protein [Alkalicoccus chagannorensis]|uniref:DUF805 domain-containing protein n=1 Tax=Alkalicoccus chagannorensis TaxID=427072 RepID=UPI000410EE2C|nr:DUF805 domain-containing protein [Alkalicoccus chagannorensis]